MSELDFQIAFAEILATPSRLAAFLADPTSALEGRSLTPGERERLLALPRARLAVVARSVVAGKVAHLASGVPEGLRRLLGGEVLSASLTRLLEAEPARGLHPFEDAQLWLVGWLAADLGAVEALPLPVREALHFELLRAHLSASPLPRPQPSLGREWRALRLGLHPGFAVAAHAGDPQALLAAETSEAREAALGAGPQTFMFQHTDHGVQVQAVHPVFAALVELVGAAEDGAALVAGLAARFADDPAFHPDPVAALDELVEELVVEVGALVARRATPGRHSGPGVG